MQWFGLLLLLASLYCVVAILWTYSESAHKKVPAEINRMYVRAMHFTFLTVISVLLVIVLYGALTQETRLACLRRGASATSTASPQRMQEIHTPLVTFICPTQEEELSSSLMG